MWGVVPLGVHGGVVPRGTAWGGVGRGKKVPEKMSIFFCPNRVINSICACFRKSVFFISNFFEKKNRPTWGV